MALKFSTRIHSLHLSLTGTVLLTFEQLKLSLENIFDGIDPFLLLLRAASLQNVVLIPGINLSNGSRSHGETTGVVPFLLGNGEAVYLEGILVCVHAVGILLLGDDQTLVEEKDVSACSRPTRSLIHGKLILWQWRGRGDSMT